MFKKTIPLAVAVVLSLSAGAAVADQTFHPSKDEGTVMHVVPGTKSRAQIEADRNEADRNAAARNVATPDEWRYVGGETGWELIPHAYSFRNGKLVHADKFDHSTPKPSLASIKQARNFVTADGWRYVGGERESELVQHTYEFRQGTLTHADNCFYGPPKSRL